MNLGGGRDSNIDKQTAANVGGTIFGGAGTDSRPSVQTSPTPVLRLLKPSASSHSDSTADSADLITFTNSISGTTAGATTGYIAFNIALDGLGSAHTAEGPG